MKINQRHITGLLYLYLFILLVLHTMPTSGVEELGEYYLGIRGDHWIHATMFFPMGFLVLQVFFGKKIRAYGIIIFACFFFETLQYFLPYRSFDFYDIVADSVGAFFGILIFHSCKKVSKNF